MMKANYFRHTIISSFLLSSILLAGEEPLLKMSDLHQVKIRPLDLERIIIRGRGRQSPASLPKVDQSEVKIDNPVALRPRSFPKKTLWSDRLEFTGGQNNSWKVGNRYHLKSHFGSLGFSSATSGTSGFRTGYAKDYIESKLEFEKLDPRHPEYSLSSSFKKSSMELPEPEGQAHLGQYRWEKMWKNRFKMVTPWHGDDRFELYLDLNSARQENTGSLPIESRLIRSGFLYTRGSWKTALTLEKDRRGDSRSVISRFFVQNTHHPLDERTNLHWGLGTYVISNKNHAIQKTGSFLLPSSTDKKKGVALSPYIQIDQQISKNLALYGAYSQFFESEPFIESYFDQPELSRANERVQPTQNNRFEVGVHYNLKGDWDMALMGERNNYRNKLVTVEDVASGNLKYRSEFWDRGHESRLFFQLAGTLADGILMRTHLETRRSRWLSPVLNYTPNRFNRVYKLSLEKIFAKTFVKLTYEHLSSRRDYPDTRKLPSTIHANLELKQSFLSGNFKVWTRVNNLLNRKNYRYREYPDSPIFFEMGFGFKI